MVKKKNKKEKTAFEKLNPKYQTFVKEYVRNVGIGYKAYLVIKPNSKKSTARTEACKLLTKPNIKQAIEDEFKKIWSEKDSEIEKSKTYKMIHHIGNSNIADVVDLENNTLTVKSLEDIPIEAQNAIQGVEYIEKETSTGIEKHVKVKLHPKLKALELRAKIQKIIDPKDDAQLIEIKILPPQRPKE